MLLLSHPTGNQFVRMALDAFDKESILSEYITGYAGFPSASSHALLKLFIKDFSRREYPEKFKEITDTKPFDELSRLFLQRNSFLKRIQNLNSYFSIDENFKRHDLYVANKLNKANKNIKMVYAYEDAAFHSFKIAIENNLTTIYDLPIGYWKSGQFWQEKAALNQPYLRNTIRALNETGQKIEKKESELQMAKHIIVASSFTKSTLINTDYYNKATVIPYGFPDPVAEKKIEIGKKLRILFVGGLTQRKGIGEVLESVDPYKKHIDLTIIGNLTEIHNAELMHKLAQHNWIRTLPHAEILKSMDQHDLLIFPSWFEGFGLVISEAMSRGLPVITTMNTGAAEFLKNSINGWLVTPGSTDEIKEILEIVLANREILYEMSKSAILTAKERPWSNYQFELANFVLKQNAGF